MTYKFEQKGDVIVIKMAGKLIAKHQSTALLEQVEDKTAIGMAKFVLDLSELEVMNSTGLSVLLTILTKARKEDGEVVLTGVNATLGRLLVITKLQSIFQVEQTIEDSIAALSV